MPTKTSPPTFTPAPPPTPTLGTSQSYRNAPTDTAFAYLVELVEELGPRESATEQELAAAEYLAARLEGFGYTVELQPFTMEQLSGELSIPVLVTPGPEKVEAIPLLRSATGEVSGMLVPVGLAQERDIPEGGLEDKIALAERGLITFEEKVNRAAEAGAVAVVIYNNQPGKFQGILQTPGRIPALAISQADGRRIEGLLSSGAVEVDLAVKTEKRVSRNVVAEKPGPGDDVVVLGGHYDTVPGISGANDNGSGTAVLLTVAGELSREPLPFTLRFIAFGSEELGLMGSQHYVDSLTGAQRGRIKAMFNFDALGNGGLGILGDRELTGLAVVEAAARLINVTTSAGLQGGGSDHMSFDDAGIPVIMFFAEDFSRLHTPADTLAFVDPGVLGDAAGLALALLKPQDFPAILN